MKNEQKRNHQAIAAQFRRAGIHVDQNRKVDKKNLRREARQVERRSMCDYIFSRF